MPAVTGRGPAHRDRGAVATVVALLLASGVLLGFLALVVDVGQIYVEREELQTGADAAALAVGRACANEQPACETTADLENLVQTYADANSSDDVSNVVDVCGRLEDKLSACGAAPDNLTRCLGTEPGGSTPFVEVRLSTELPGARFALPPAFAQAMAGNEGYDGISVASCARVTWEKEEDVKVLAMTVSTCELAGAPDGGPAPYGPLDEYVIDFVANAHGDCAGVPEAPWQVAGPAGWLNGDGQCELDLPNDGRASGDDLLAPDYEPPSACSNRLDNLVNTGDEVFVPVHDAHDHIGTTTEYRHTGVVKFVVTGYELGPGGSRDSSITNTPPCEPADDRRCVSGVFIGAPQPLSSLAGDAIVKLIG